MKQESATQTGHFPVAPWPADNSTFPAGFPRDLFASQLSDGLNSSAGLETYPTPSSRNFSFSNPWRRTTLSTNYFLQRTQDRCPSIAESSLDHRLCK